MQMALIESKLNRPKTLATHINRPHLTARLIEANVPMVLVSSVAGSGKSSLISSWLKESHIKRYVWYSLDEWDSDFILFFNYLAEGIRRIEPSIGDTLTSLLLNASSFDHAGLVRAAVGVLQTLEQPIYLVLDDYHLVENADIDNAIRAFVTYLNSQLVVVLISREDPMIDLSTLRMRQKLLEIRQADLSLNEMETAAYLRTFLGASYALSKQHVMMLYQRTEGWLAGLQLAGISLQSQRDTSAFIESFSGNHRYIMDYLIQEVAAKLTADETIFLMTSTILEKFCAPLLDSLIKGLPNETVNHTNAQQLIRQLMKKNLFVIELDAVQYWYRYHHLFRDSLIRYFLEKEPAVYRQYAAAVNCLAGDWYAVQNQGLEASRYYLKGNCDQKAAMELERLWAPMDMMLQTASWLTLANQLPESVIAERPLFSLAYGWALIDNGRLGDSKQWLDNASALVEALPAPLLKEKQLVSDWETYVHFHALLASARGFIAGAAGDFDSLMQYGEQALATGSAKKSGVTHMMMAFANWGQGNHVGAEQQLKNAVSAEGIHGEWLNVQNFKMVLMEHYIQTGRLAKADTLIQQLLNEGENDSVLYPTLYLGMARIAYSRGETRLCGEWLERAAKAGNVCALMDFQYKYAFFTAIFHADQGAFEEAFKQLEIGKKHFFPNPIPDMYTASAVEAWLTAMKHQRAAEIVETVDTDLLFDQCRATTSQYVNAAILIEKTAVMMTLVRACEVLNDESDLSRQRVEAVIVLCTDLEAIAQEHLALEAVVHFKLMQWRLLKCLNAVTAAEALASSLKAFSKKTQIVRPFILQLQPSAYRQWLGMSLDEDTKNVSASMLSEPLTARELEVMFLIADGYSNQEIADRLYIALSTVKGYIQNIYGKLEVRRRTEAVQKARQLGLV